MTATHSHASHRYPNMSLNAWVSRLVEEFPGFDEYDIAGLIEERTGIPIARKDFESIRALYLRTKLRAWVPEGEDNGE